MAKFAFIGSDNDITKEIGKIKTAGQKLQMNIHRVAVSILKRWNETGDCRPALKNMQALHDAFPQSLRTNAFKDWAQAYAQMVWEEQAFAWGAKPVVPTDKDIEAAIGNPFWDFSPEKPYQPIDFTKLIQNVIKKAEKDMKEMGEKSTVDKEALLQLVKLAGN